MAKSKSLIYEA